MRPLLPALALLLALPAPAAPQQQQPAPAAPRARLPDCRPLPAPRGPWAWRPGEVLEYRLDAMGAEAGTLTLRALPPKGGQLPMRAEVETNTFFSKVRRFRASAQGLLDPRTLKPSRYTEESVENDLQRRAEVRFDARTRSATVDYRAGRGQGQTRLSTGPDALDLAGAAYLFRQLPLAEGQEVCFDVYALRRIWRVTGTVQKREKVSLAVGDFDAWHLAGTATRTDRPESRREVHVWVSDDARRLPLAAVGTTDVGVVRASLAAVQRPGERPRRGSEGKDAMKW